MTDTDKAHAAWAHLQAARQAGPGAPFPEAVRPRTAQEAYAIQALSMDVLGPIGGWKVGAAGPDAPCSCAPMPESGLYESPALLDAATYNRAPVESEIAFVLGRDLPPRAEPYSGPEVLAALATCHAGLEVLRSRFADPDATDALSNLADLIRHGAYVLGPSIAGWREIDFASIEVRQTMDGDVVTRVGNPAGDMLRLMTWLANEGAVWAGGLLAGQIVTCGSWTGAKNMPDRTEVVAQFGHLPAVTLRVG